MSIVSSGTGLISGLPISDLIDAMLSVDKQPVTLMQNNLSELTNRRTALLQISAQLAAMQNAVLRLDSADFFRTAKAASSDEGSILATAGTGASPGQYTFTVRSLAASHQLISRGFATRSETPVGAGTFTIESAEALLNRSTSLSRLNGGDGVPAGKIRITDRAGRSAQIDLTTAQTIDDVVSAINGQTSADVRARIDGDHLLLEDETGLTTGSLSVAEVGAGRTAAGLGLSGSSSTGTIAGSNVVFLSNTTRLINLNDGNGVRHAKNQSDFSVSLADGSVLQFGLSEYLATDMRLSMLNNGAGVPGGQISLTNKAGKTATVDLAGATTIGDVKTAIESSGLGLTVSFSGAHLVVTDGSSGKGQTKIEEVGDGTTAQALGLLGSSSGGTLKGKDIYFVRTVGDVLRVINSDPANGGKLVASISSSGTGLTLTDTTTGASQFQVTAMNGSQAAEDLGFLTAAAGGLIESRRLLAGLSSVLTRSLNGGKGVDLGQIQVTDRAGTSATVDLSGAQTLADIIAAINAAPTEITASVSSSGLSVELVDTSNGSGPLQIEDLTGTTAHDLNIEFNGAAGSVSSGNLQKQYVSSAMRLSEFRGGIPAGKFRITNSLGKSAVVDLTQGNEQTLQDVIDEINSRGISVTARINDTGDGLLLEDTAGGGGLLKVTEEGSGSTAQSLNILGSAATGKTTIDGSFETRVTVTGADTLDTVLAKLKSSRAPVNAAILNDGASGQPYRLNLSSSRSGRDGALAIDSGTTGLSFGTLVQGRDAAVLLGPADAESPFVLTSSTNTLSDTISGVRLDLIAPSQTPVTVSITKDTDSVASDLSNFVSAFNAVISTIDKLSAYNTDTQERGILNADATTRNIRDSLISMVNSTVAGLSGKYTRLSSVGITLSGGNSLAFDEDKFKQAMASDATAVEDLFTTADTGFGTVIKNEIKHFTDTDTGVIPLQDQSLQDSARMLNDRITQMNALIEKRRARLQEQFNAMETTLAKLQSQQTALTALSNFQLSLNSSSSSSSGLGLKTSS
ncbi:MAG TPA: flagellar filament capping protein FliD [Phycisphaerae bacterium]|nr:flagellar filament capping protein FliD [Phycisphaerae bacterium]